MVRLFIPRDVSEELDLPFCDTSNDYRIEVSLYTLRRFNQFKDYDRQYFNSFSTPTTLILKGVSCGYWDISGWINDETI